MTKSEVGRRAGVSPQAIGKVERGENATLDLLMKITAVLDCTLETRIRTPDEPANAAMMRAALDVPPDLTAEAAQLLSDLPHIPARHLPSLLALFATYRPGQ